MEDKDRGLQGGEWLYAIQAVNRRKKYKNRYFLFADSDYLGSFYLINLLNTHYGIHY